MLVRRAYNHDAYAETPSLRPHFFAKCILFSMLYDYPFLSFYTFVRFFSAVALLDGAGTLSHVSDLFLMCIEYCGWRVWGVVYFCVFTLRDFCLGQKGLWVFFRFLWLQHTKSWLHL